VTVTAADGSEADDGAVYMGVAVMRGPGQRGLNEVGADQVEQRRCQLGLSHHHADLAVEPGHDLAERAASAVPVELEIDRAGQQIGDRHLLEETAKVEFLQAAG